MDNAFLQSLWSQYHIGLSLLTFVGIIAATVGFNMGLAAVSKVYRAAVATNRQVFEEKMQRPSYAENQAWNRKWAIVDQIIIFFGIVPFCVTLDMPPLWRFGVDIVVILMVYDFFYYLTHRFVFHDTQLFGKRIVGPLKWMHAYHHRQHNPCRKDSSYIHPLEVFLGLGLYVATIFVLSRFMGSFHVVTIILTWVAFSEINQHNHDRWTEDRFPFKYFNYASVLHHYHHARFTGGNFATISPLYDWMFGTLDEGKGYPAEVK